MRDDSKEPCGAACALVFSFNTLKHPAYTLHHRDPGPHLHTFFAAAAMLSKSNSLSTLTRQPCSAASSSSQGSLPLPFRIVRLGSKPERQEQQMHMQSKVQADGQLGSLVAAGQHCATTCSCCLQNASAQRSNTTPTPRMATLCPRLHPSCPLLTPRPRFPALSFPPSTQTKPLPNFASP